MSTFPPAFTPGSKPRSRKIRVVIRFPRPLPSAISQKSFPVATRPLNTIPCGSPAPIFSQISCKPRGVPNESATFDGSRSEVETSNTRAHFPFLKKYIRCSESRTTSTRATGLIPKPSLALVTHFQIFSSII